MTARRAPCEGWRLPVSLTVDQKIVEWLEEQYEPVRTRQVSEALGLDYRRTNRALLRLSNDGAVLDVGTVRVVGAGGRGSDATLWVATDRDARR